LLSRFLARLLRLPLPAEAVGTRLRVSPSRDAERWFRAFGGRRLVTMQRERRGLLAERFGVLEFLYRLQVVEQGLEYDQKVVALALGPFLLRLPFWLSPRVVARESPGKGPHHTQVDVRVTHPLLGLLLAYKGQLERKEPHRCQPPCGSWPSRG